MKRRARQRVLDLVNDALDQQRLCAAADKRQSNQLSRGVKCGILVRPYPGLYATADRWEGLTPDEQTLYAARAMSEKHPDWVFAGPTAALAHGLNVSWNCLDSIYIVARQDSRARDRGDIRHITVTGDAPVQRNGIMVTSFRRTVCDCLRLLPFRDALAVADSSLRNARISRKRLLTNIESIYHRKPGMQRIRSIIELADGRSENGGESIVRAQIISLGFAVPDLQYEILDPLTPGKVYRADFAWHLPDGSLVLGELDGREKYHNPEMTDGKDIDETLLAERRRESRITLGDRRVRIVRFSLAEALNSEFFERLLTAYGIPRMASVPEVARQSK